MALSDNQGSRDLELLSAYIDDELNDVQRTALEARLERDPDLRRQLDDLRLVVQAVQNLPTLRAPRDFTLTADMVAEPAQPQREAATFFLFPTSTAFSALSAAAATLLIAFGLLLLLLSSGASQTAAPFSADSVQQAPPNIAAAPSDTPSLAIASTVIPTQTFAPTSTSTPLPTAASTSIIQSELDDEAFAEDDLQDMELGEVAAEEALLEAAPAQAEEFTESADEFAFDTDAVPTLEAQAQVMQPEAPPIGANGVDPSREQAAMTATPTVTPSPAAAAGGSALRLNPTGTVVARVLPTVAARVTLAPPPQPTVESQLRDAAITQVISLVAIAAGVVLSVLAVGTTIVRRRNRHGNS